MSHWTALIESHGCGRRCLLGWATLFVLCSRVCSHFPAAYSHILSLSLSLPYTVHGVVFVVVVLGNGLNSPHSADKNGPGDRQSTMPPSVPIRKDKKDVPVRTLPYSVDVWQHFILVYISYTYVQYNDMLMKRNTSINGAIFCPRSQSVMVSLQRQKSM